MISIGQILVFVLLLALLRVVLTYFGHSARRDDAQKAEQAIGESGLNSMLYWVMATVIVISPVVAFIVASELNIRPLGAGVFSVIGLLVLLSMPITLMIARSWGPRRYESYWRHLEGRSRMNRKRIVVLWLAMCILAFSLGIADFVRGSA